MRAGRGQHEQQGRTALLSSSQSSPSISASSLPERGISASSLPERGISGSSSLCQLSQRATRDDGTHFSLFPGHEPRVESGYSSLEKTAPDSRQPSLSLVSDENTPRRLQVTGQFEGDHREYVDNSSSSELSSSSSFSNATQHVRHNRLHFSKKEEQSLGSALQQASPGVPRSALPRYRPSKSLDRRAAEATTTPDLLNFKKGWMTRLDDDGQWKKYWFVLTDLILRFYRNPMAEEAADMDGEMNLSTCYDITDFPAQKNYGFQIHKSDMVRCITTKLGKDMSDSQTKDGVYTLCAMTAVIRRNWVQAVRKNVRPAAAPDVTRSLPDQKAPQGQQRPDPVDPHPLERHRKLEQQKSDIRELCLEGRYNTFDWPEFNCKEEEEELSRQPKGGRDTADGGSASPISSTVSSSIASSSSYTALQEDEGLEKGRGLCLQAPHMTRPSETDATGVTKTTTAGTPKDRSEKGLEVDSSTSASDLRADAADMQVKVEQQQVENTPEREERQVPTSTTSELAEERERLSSEQHTVELVRELEQTQRELSRLKQINDSLQYQLEQESEHDSREGHQQNCLLPSTESFSSDEANAWQRLQKRNEDLCSELEAQRRSQNEVELQRRVEVLALQAQVLRAGEAAALASPKLGQEQQRCQEQQEEWDRCMVSMQAQLSNSEERRREAEFGLRQEVSRHVLQQETERLRKRLQEVSARLSANEEVQAQKEERLQKHLGLLQDSQDRERRSLAASLAQAERQVQVLQEQLQKAKQHQESVRTGETWTSGVEEAQKQLQDELACTVAAVMTLQEEREHLERRCQELQNQLAEADGEVSRTQSRLQTEETDYYNLEHSYERVCEELQRALGQAQDREAAVRDAQEGYERLLDRKEQDLSEALVKMSALGSSLEETELKLSEAKGGCTCSSCPPERTYDESIQQEDMGQQQAVGPLFKVTDNRLKIKSSNLHLGETQTLCNSNGAATNCSISEMGYSRARSRSVDPAYQYIVTEGDDPDRFMSIIQVLENKLYVTEEKLRDITERLEEPPGDIPQRLEEPQGQWSGADPHVRSQLNQSRARAQQLSLLLHNQAKQSQRFALETESHTRVLSDQFQAALASIEACRERLQPLLQNPGAGTANIDASLCSLEMQLATAAACLMKGGKAAEEQRFACLQAQREEEIVVDKTLPEVKVEKTGRCMCTKMLSLEEGGVGTFSRVLALEASILEKMASALQSRDYTPGTSDSHLGGDEGDVVHMYVKVLSKRMAMEMEERTQDGKQSGSSTEFEMSVIGRVCARAELAYIALTLQRRYEGELQGDLHSDDTTREHLWQGSKPEEQCGASNKLSSSQSRSLADVSPPELAPYEEQVQPKTRGLKEEMLERNLERNPFVWGTDNSEKQDWIEKLAAQLQRKAMVLRTVCHEIPNSIGSEGSREGRPWLDVSDSAMTVYPLWELLAQAQVTYVAYRLQLDYEQKLQTCKVQLDSLQALCHEQEATLSKERLTLSHNLSHLQEDSDTLRERLEWAEQKRVTTETETQQKVEVLLADIDNIEYRHEQQVQKLEENFQGKMMELQQIHEKEMEHLHCLYACSSSVAMDAQTTPHPLTTSPPETTTIDSALQADGPRKDLMSTAIHMLETQVNTTKEELGSQHLEGDALAMREAYQRDLKNLKESCERGFNAMKEVHQKLVGDLQRQHQREVTTLMQEKDRLLEEETVATVAAIEAMRKAHNEELEKSKHLQLSGVSPDITVLRSKYEDDLQSLHRELEVLSGQYSQKCLESSHVDHAREAERQARLQCQREIQELNTQKQELTHRLTEEISRMCSCLNGELADTGLQEKDFYELEVILRVRDTELHCLRQETHSLKEELKAALRDKAYATDNLKALCAELSISQEKAQYDITGLREELCAAIGASRDEGCGSSTGVQGNGIVQSKSNPDFLKGRTTLTRQIRGLRSRSLKEGLSVQERMKLFDSLDSQKN